MNTDVDWDISGLGSSHSCWRYRGLTLRSHTSPMNSRTGHMISMKTRPYRNDVLYKFLGILWHFHLASSLIWIWNRLKKGLGSLGIVWFCVESHPLPPADGPVLPQQEADLLPWPHAFSFPPPQGRAPAGRPVFSRSLHLENSRGSIHFQHLKKKKLARILPHCEEFERVQVI